MNAPNSIHLIPIALALPLVWNSISSPAEAANDGLTVAKQSVSSRTLKKNLEVKAYAARSLYADADQDTDELWHYGTLIKGRWSLSRRWTASLLTDIRYSNRAEPDTVYVRFPREMELGLTYNLPVSSEFAIDVATAGVAPIDRTRQRQEDFLGAVKVSPSVTWRLPTFAGIDTSASAGVWFLKNFHSYEEQESGEPNTSSETQGFAGLKILPSAHTTLNLLGERIWASTYTGQTHHLYAVTTEALYHISSHVTLGVGHINKSLIMSADQRSSNIALFTEDRSMVYGSIAYQTSHQGQHYDF